MADEITTRHLQGITDLTLTAPIRHGFVPSIDSRSYKSRLKAVLDALHALRVASREHAAIRPFSDSTDRIRTIQSLRIAILEPENKLLLSVSFDRPLEPYLRVVWRQVGILLDLIFCNCEGYVTAHDHGFADYGAWILGARVDTRFFYNNGALTVDDQQLLRQLEKLHREQPAGAARELAAARLVPERPEQQAERAITAGLAQQAETLRLGLQALSFLYRLTDLYPPGTDDGGILLRAAHELLREFKLPPAAAPQLAAWQRDAKVRQRFGAQLEWFDQQRWRRDEPPRAEAPDEPATVQGGILTPYVGVTHGALLLLAFDDPAQADALLAALRPTTMATPQRRGRVYTNLAFTCAGLRKLGLDDAALAEFPIEFREGMEDRAGQLGDLRGNHPRNWTLPPLNWPPSATAEDALPRVQLGTVDLIVQLRIVHPKPVADDHRLVGNAAHPLAAALQRVATLAQSHGARLLSVQAMRRRFAGGRSREHFGFADPLSQPLVGDEAKGRHFDDRVALGEVLLGYAGAEDAPPARRSALLHNGSFLVVRKLRQDVAALDDLFVRYQAGGGTLSRAALMTRLMGRGPDGQPPVTPPPDALHANDYDFRADHDGRQCPLFAHARRANPRISPDADAPIPRIVRRGMSYGPDHAAAPAERERGMVFMGYNASIGGQFELIQRWLVAGNSAGGFSGQGDPFMGVPTAGEPRVLAFEVDDGGTPRIERITLDAPGAPPRPLVQLEWGSYAFVPSTRALARLRQMARRRHAAPPVQRGVELIRALRRPAPGGASAAERWKEVLEDGNARVRGDTEAVWAAIRARHGGILRTPFGVLVGSRTLVHEVMDDPHRRYSVCGYAERQRESFGEIYLGLDDDRAAAQTPYRRQATPPNSAAMAIPRTHVFQPAYDIARAVVAALRDGAVNLARGVGAPGWELTFEVREVTEAVLARLCSALFGLPMPAVPGPEGGAVPAGPLHAGGWDWNLAGDAARAPRCPGHFTAPSRFMFQPQPGPTATRFGQQHGRQLAAALRPWAAGLATADAAQLPPLTQAIVRAFVDPARPQDPAAIDLVTRTVIGVMMGFLPTTDGNLRATLDEWLDKKLFWDLQRRYADAPGATPFERAAAAIEPALKRTLQLRPVPGLIWRTATVDHALGRVAIGAGERIVVGIVSAGHEALAAGEDDHYLVFGGRRTAAGANSPTHACPGYEIGMGVMLGVLAGLMDAGALRPTPAPLTFQMSGPTPPP